MVASVFETGAGVLVGGTDVNVALGETSAAAVGAAGVRAAGGVPQVTASSAMSINPIIAKEFQMRAFIRPLRLGNSIPLAINAEILSVTYCVVRVTSRRKRNTHHALRSTSYLLFLDTHAPRATCRDVLSRTLPSPFPQTSK